MTLKEQTKQKIEDTKELILQMIPTRTSELINDTDYNYGYLDSNLILHLLNVNATLSSSQTIVSNGSTMTINALVTDSDGNTISNAPVQFYINGTASGNPINTDSNGIATYTYSGTGIGKVKVYAKVGTFLSETFVLTDCTKMDKGTIAEHSDIWSISTTSSICTVTRTNEYTEFKETTTGVNFSNSVTGLTDSCIVELDYWQLDSLNNTFMQIQNSSSQQIYGGGINLGSLNGSLETWYHLKITIQNRVATIQNTINGATITKNLTDTPYKFVFWSSGDVSALRFKNFMIYPI